MVDQSKQIDLAKNQLVVESLTVGGTTPGNIAIAAAPGTLGYTTGAGGSVTQGTSGTTAVTLNTATGIVTLFGNSLATVTGYSFAITDSIVGIADSVIVNPTTASFAALGLQMYA